MRRVKSEVVETIIPDTVHHVVKAVESSEKAWGAATTTGSRHLQTLLNALTTMHDQTHVFLPRAGAGTLKQMHDAATASWEALRTTIRRLRSIQNGMQRWTSEIQVLQSSSSSGLSLLQQSTRMFAEALAKDVGEKEDVLHDIQDSVAKGRPLPPDHAVRLAAQWSESLALVGVPDADTVYAIAYATYATDPTDDVVGTPTRSAAGSAAAAAAGETSQQSQLSPALRHLTTQRR